MTDADVAEAIDEVEKALDEFWRYHKKGDARAQQAAEHFERLKAHIKVVTHG
jgi:hypothetical protein